MEHEVIIASTSENNAVLEESEVICLPIKTANTIAQTYLENISSDDLYEAEAALKDLGSLVQRVTRQAVKAGDADDWQLELMEEDIKLMSLKKGLPSCSA